jgi:phosphate-selective porin
MVPSTHCNNSANGIIETGSMSEASTYVTGRLTGQLLSDDIHGRLLHVGLAARYSDFTNESIRFRSKPGIPFVPDFLDTGDMPGDSARWLTGEFAYRKDRLFVSGEYIRTDLDSPAIGNPIFIGSYLWAEWSLTGEVRNYNAEKGLFTRPLPAHDFGKGGAGHWSMALGANDTELNEGVINGGDMQQVMFSINWYPPEKLSLGPGT